MNLFVEIIVVMFQFWKELFSAIYRSVIHPPEKSVRGEVVLITGAGSGLGRLMSIEFAKRGATIIACDINGPGNQETADIVKSNGGTIYTYICDVSKRENIYELADKVKRDIGDVTILINNAGIVTGKKFLDCPDSMIQKTMDINLMAHFWTTKTFLPSMLERNHGHIVNIASIAGHVGCTYMTDYCGSKFGNVGFTESLELELNSMGKDGVITTTVCPYFIKTGMFDGCKSKFPLILPDLEPEYVVSEILHAVLINQRLLYIPKSLSFSVMLKTMLPLRAGMVLQDFIGATQFMESYVGRQGGEALNGKKSN